MLLCLAGTQSISLLLGSGPFPASWRRWVDQDICRGCCPIPPTWGFTSCWRLWSHGMCMYTRRIRGEVKREPVTHFSLPRQLLAGLVSDLWWDTWSRAAGVRGWPDSSKVHPFHGLSMAFTGKHKICNSDVSVKAWLTQEGEIWFVLFQFFEFSNCVSAWQNRSPNTFHLLIVPVKSRNNTEMLIQSIIVNISQDSNVYRELSEQFIGKE